MPSYRTVGAFFDGTVLKAGVCRAFLGSCLILQEIALQAVFQAGNVREPIVLGRLQVLSAIDHPIEQTLLSAVLTHWTLRGVQCIAIGNIFQTKRRKGVSIAWS